MKSPSEITWPEAILEAIDAFSAIGELRSARLVDRTAKSWVAFIIAEPGQHPILLVWVDRSWLRLRPELGERTGAVCAELRARPEAWEADWAPTDPRRIAVRSSTTQWPQQWYGRDREAIQSRSAS